MTRNRIISAVALVFSVAFLGCGGGSNSGNAARVSGSLTYNGQPVKGGVMCFHDSQGVVFPAALSPDGTYSANDIGTGEMVVTVDTEALNPAKTGSNVPKGPLADARMAASQATQKRGDGPAGGNAPAPDTSAGHYTKIPAKYANAKTSTYTVNLKPGRQVINIELTD